MLGAAARLQPTADDRVGLERLTRACSVAARTVYGRVARGVLPAERRILYRTLTKDFGLTAHQADTLTAQVLSWRQADADARDRRIAQLQAWVVKHTDDVRSWAKKEATAERALTQSIAAWDRRRTTAATLKKASAPKAISPSAAARWRRTTKITTSATPCRSISVVPAPNRTRLGAGTAHPRDARRTLAQTRRVHRAKAASLAAKNAELKLLTDAVANGVAAPARVVGSKKLLAQRRRIGQPDSPYASTTAWRQEWERKRNGSLTLTGKAADAGGNRGMQVHFARPDARPTDSDYGTAVLRIRLTNALAAERRRVWAQAAPGRSEHDTAAAECDWITVPVVFAPSRATALRQALAHGQPITVTIALTPVGRGTRRTKKAIARADAHAAAQRKAKRARHGKRSAQTTAPKMRKTPTSDGPSTHQHAGLRRPIELAWTVHCAFDEPMLSRAALTAATNPTASLSPRTDRHRGTLGIDQNGWGLAWAVTTWDGNLLRGEEITLDSDAEGDDPSGPGRRRAIRDIVLKLGVRWDRPNGRGPTLTGCWTVATEGKSAHQIRAQYQHGINLLVELARLLEVAVALEALDFTKKTTYLRATGPRYNRMIRRFPHAKVLSLTTARCRKAGVTLHRVDPAWTSVAGWAKYGRILGLNTDQAAAYQIARSATLGVLPDWVGRPIATVRKKGKAIAPKWLRQQQQRQDNAMISHAEPPRCARPLRSLQRNAMARPAPSGSEHTEHTRVFASWRHTRDHLGPRFAWIPHPPRRPARGFVSNPPAIRKGNQSCPRTAASGGG